MTEAQIEARVERMTDHLDRLLISGDMSQDAYDKAIRDLDEWAETKRESK